MKAFCASVFIFVVSCAVGYYACEHIKGIKSETCIKCIDKCDCTGKCCDMCDCGCK